MGFHRRIREEQGIADLRLDDSDRIFDTYLERGVRPYAQMVSCRRIFRSSLTLPAQVDTAARYEEILHGWAYPRRTTKMGRTGFQWVRSIASKSMAREVETWYWEVWNEPNIGYWRGTPEEFRKLHDYAIDAVRRACRRRRSAARTRRAAAEIHAAFLDHCLRGTNHATGKIGTPLDFVAFHAKGAPATPMATCAWASPIICARSTMAFGLSLRTRNSKANRSSSANLIRKVARRARAAARLSQRHDVFELHRGKFRAQARPC
jgi:hypothetical protein